MTESFNEVKTPHGVVAAGRSKVNYFDFRPTPVTQKNVKGIPGMDLTIKATMNSPKTSRAIRRSVNGSFGKETLLSEEFQL